MLAARYLITPEQLAAARALAGLDDTDGADPAAMLRGTQLLEPGNAELTEEAAAALRIAERPRSSLTVVTNRSGDPEWRALTLRMAEGFQGAFAVREEHDGAIDLTLLPSVTQAVVYLDELLELSRTTPGDDRVELDLAGWSALVAATDAVRESELRAELERRTDAPPPALHAAALQQQLEAGLAGNDTRWLATAAVPLTPTPLATGEQALAAGLGTLARAGLAVQADDRHALTERGLALVRELGRHIIAATLVRIEHAAGETPRASVVSLIRGPLSAWLAFWNDVGEGRGNVTLVSTSPVSGLNTLRGLLASPAG